MPYSPSHEEVDEFRSLTTRSGDPEIADAVEIIAACGMRKGEFLALFVRDVDMKKREFHVAWSIADGGPGVGIVRKPTKRSDWRDVPMTKASFAAFERQFERRRNATRLEPRGDEYVFPGEVDGLTAIRPDDLSDRLGAARGTSRLTFLDLRHYVATTMLDAGVPYRTVAELLGTSEGTLRLHYDGRTDTGKRAAIDTLERRAS